MGGLLLVFLFIPMEKYGGNVSLCVVNQHLYETRLIRKKSWQLNCVAVGENLLFCATFFRISGAKFVKLINMKIKDNASHSVPSVKQPNF